jgi:hypothetical protein
MSYYSLPFEVVLLISQVSPPTWVSLTCADPRVGRYSLDNMVAMQDYFTTCVISYGDYSAIRHLYKLPNGMLHRNGDLPAVIIDGKPYNYNSNSKLKWYRYGKLHRCDDRPAIVRSDGNQEWWVNGKRHRNGDKPAFVGIYNRENDQSLNYNNIILGYYKHGKRHRDGDKPAMIDCGNSIWFYNNLTCRGGLRPAICGFWTEHIWRDGVKCADILNYPAQVTSYNMLPYEIVILIAMYSPATWWGLVRADPQIMRGQRLHHDPIYWNILHSKFTTKTREPVVWPDGRRETRVVYRLPNGLLDNRNKPAVVYDCGLKKWYAYGKLSNFNGPAVVHDGHIKKWYVADKPYHQLGITVKYGGLAKGKHENYDNEHYCT